MGRTKCIVCLPPIDCSGEKSGSERFQLCIIISSSTAEQLLLCPQCVVSGREYRAICHTVLLLNILNIYSHTPHDITTPPSSIYEEMTAALHPSSPSCGSLPGLPVLQDGKRRAEAHISLCWADPQLSIWS